MKKFYGSMAYIGCGNGCNSKLQTLLFDEAGQPVEMDWEALREIYDKHYSICTTENLFVNDENAFYGNPNECTGFVEENESSSGYRYCEY